MPIPIEALQAVRKVVVHKRNPTTPCADGRAFAVIAHAAYSGEVPIVEVAYNSPEHREMVAEPGLLIGDFSPPADRIPEFVAAGAIVIDHHDPELVKPFGERGVWGDNAKTESGAVLAFREVLEPLLPYMDRSNAPSIVSVNLLPEIARLVAVRDTWHPDHADWEEACQMSVSLTFPPLEHLLSMGAGAILDFSDQVGPILLDRAKRAAEATVDSVVYEHVEGRDVAFVDDHHAISDAAELLGQSVDLVVAFEYVHNPNSHKVSGSVQLVVHLRSRRGVDCRALAKRHPGGGGHEGAAGYSVHVDPHDVGTSPYEVIYRHLAEAWGQ